ncbi:MAG: recombinase family protein [Acidobacteriota bacterium]|nr:recombinase family protein [Acidobacteriota bacterium]
MSTEAYRKVSGTHLERDAYLYVRQSSLRQVMHNTESTKRQYALRERAIALGWPIERIHTIDSDLGQSGADAAGRDGFQELVTRVAMGEVGIVLGLEVSRLARNNADWHRLIELAALSRTLILDEDGVYDPSHFNDRLLLGLKGTMSEAELHVLKARLQGGILSKARRGELQTPLPIGLVYQANGAVAFDPDGRIRGAVELLFATFRETGSASATLRRFNREGIEFPRRIRHGVHKGEVHWSRMEHSRILQILHNPRYAGAFVYGRTASVRTPEMRTAVVSRAREDWTVLIQGVHVGYIGWEEYEANQSTLKRNRQGFSIRERGSMPREGAALLQGRLMCGKCGRRMQTRYQMVRKSVLEPYYQCSHESVRHAGKMCQSIRGNYIDRTMEKLLLETVAPEALNVALAIQDEIAGRIRQADDLRVAQLEQARYESELARRRYLNVDPENRRVADSLEADWNQQMIRLEDLQEEHDRQRARDRKLLDQEAREKIMALSEDFPRVWNDPRTQSIDRKRMMGLLVEDVTLTKRETITVAVRFRGGRTHTFAVPLPLPMSRVRKTPDETVARLNELLDSFTDHEAARRLNELGHRTWQGHTYTAKKVKTLRKAYGLRNRRQRLLDQGFVPAKTLGGKLGVSNNTIHEWGRRGLLERIVCDKRSHLYRLAEGKTILKGQGSRSPRPPVVVDNRLSSGNPDSPCEPILLEPHNRQSDA